MINYMIHCCVKREYYVDNYLIPSMIKQGIKTEQITKYVDRQGEGNLKSCIKSFQSLPYYGITWHLQDDVMISHDFKEQTEAHDNGIVAGFCQLYSKRYPAGYVRVDNMWYSFPCIRIPNKIAVDFADWYINIGSKNPKYKMWVNLNKFDDDFFKAFLIDTHVADNIFVCNLAPNIVEHIDYMIGGSTINYHCPGESQSQYWNDKQLTEELYERIKNDTNFNNLSSYKH